MLVDPPWQAQSAHGGGTPAARSTGFVGGTPRSGKTGGCLTLKPVTLVTGGSAGIGAAFARLFAERGHECALVARRGARLTALADEIAAAGHKRPHVVPLDLADCEAPSRLANELTACELEPAIVVNNAGFGLRGSAAELSRAEQIEMIDVNVRALTALALHCLDSLQR